MGCFNVGVFQTAVKNSTKMLNNYKISLPLKYKSLNAYSEPTEKNYKTVLFVSPKIESWSICKKNLYHWSTSSKIYFYRQPQEILVRSSCFKLQL